MAHGSTGSAPVVFWRVRCCSARPTSSWAARQQDGPADSAGISDAKPLRTMARRAWRFWRFCRAEAFYFKVGCSARLPVADEDEELEWGSDHTEVQPGQSAPTTRLPSPADVQGLTAHQRCSRKALPKPSSGLPLLGLPPLVLSPLDCPPLGGDPRGLASILLAPPVGAMSPLALPSFCVTHRYPTTLRWNFANRKHRVAQRQDAAPRIGDATTTPRACRHLRDSPMALIANPAWREPPGARSEDDGQCLNLLPERARRLIWARERAPR